MSENRNHGTRDFSQYDTMETEALEEILRLDAEAPEDAESDVELLLYIMGVLAERRKQSNITGYTVQDAWESFQKHYMPVECLEPEEAPKRITGPWLRRLTAAAAAVVLVVAIPVTAKALGGGELWNVIAHWAKETFSFVSRENTEISEPNPISEEGYTSLQDALEKSNRDPSLVPTWIPDGYVLEKIEKVVSPVQEIYRAFYSKTESELRIRVQTNITTDIQNVETNDNFSEIYNAAGVDYYIFTNMDQLQVIWVIDVYECSISGDLTLEQAKQMIDSIVKG